MESIVITWRELLIGAILILGIYVAEVLLLTRSGKGRGFNAEARDHGRHELELEVARLHERLDKIQAEVERLKIVQTNAARPYGEAVKMAEDGMEVDQLAANCGISQGEAELIIAVNRLSRQKNTL